jgi:hypothetical protein
MGSGGAVKLRLSELTRVVIKRGQQSWSPRAVMHPSRNRRWASAHRCYTLNRIMNLFPLVEARDVGSVAVRSSLGGHANAAFPTRIASPSQRRKHLTISPQ